LKIIEIPPLGGLDLSLMEDIRFYARFLAMFASKMKKDCVRKDNDFYGTGLNQGRIDQADLQAREEAEQGGNLSQVSSKESRRYLVGMVR
jgi:hypothetical protein